MNTRRLSKTLSFVLLPLFFSGCVSDAQYAQSEEAIAILIQKVDRLESFHQIADHPSVPVYLKKSTKSPIVKYVRTESVVLAGCDKYGWCRLKGQSGYVQKWRFLHSGRSR